MGPINLSTVKYKTQSNTKLNIVGMSSDKIGLPDKRYQICMHIMMAAQAEAHNISGHDQPTHNKILYPTWHETYPCRTGFRQNPINQHKELKSM